MKLLTENTSEAIKDFEKSVELNPTFPIAYVQKLYTEYRAAQETSDQGTIFIWLKHWYLLSGQQFEFNFLF